MTSLHSKKSVRIIIKNKQRKYPIDQKQVRRWVRELLSTLGKTGLEVGLMFVSRRAIQAINQRYRDKDVPTDVLSFPIGAGDGGSYLLGDIVISPQQADEEGHLFHHGYREHLLFLVIHGLLHLFGYDHEVSPKEARRMQRQEKKLFDSVMENG